MKLLCRVWPNTLRTYSYLKKKNHKKQLTNKNLNQNKQTQKPKTNKQKPNETTTRFCRTKVMSLPGEHQARHHWKDNILEWVSINKLNANPVEKSVSLVKIL